jgi:methyl-accepting chemotaxis protein
VESAAAGAAEARSALASIEDLAQQTSAAAAELTKAAAEIGDQANVLTERIGRFAIEVRAA